MTALISGRVIEHSRRTWDVVASICTALICRHEALSHSLQKQVGTGRIWLCCGVHLQKDREVQLPCLP